jgi:hypothetical protein
MGEPDGWRHWYSRVMRNETSDENKVKGFWCRGQVDARSGAQRWPESDEQFVTMARPGRSERLAGRSKSFDIRNMRTAHTTVLDGYALRAQAARLLPMLQRCLREHDPATGADDTMPREVQFLGCGFQREPGQPRAARQSGGARNGPIGRYHPAGNHSDHVPDRLNRGTVPDGRRASRGRSLGLPRQK